MNINVNVIGKIIPKTRMHCVYVLYIKFNYRRNWYLTSKHNDASEVVFIIVALWVFRAEKHRNT